MTARFDVFLCHNHFDKPEVQKIKNELRKAGLRPFLDESDLPVGHRWVDYLLTAMDNSSSSAIFIGNRGFGKTQEKEIRHLRGNSFNQNIPFIPVYLPSASRTIQLPNQFSFIKNKDYLGVDFRSGGDSDPMGTLIRAIRGTNPQNNPPRSTQPQIAEDDLPSERGVDYTRLRDLLKAGKWKEADQETARLMLKVANRETEGWLDNDSIKKFPCTDLRTIDQLWVEYSNGRFAFSVQKRIWESVNGNEVKFARKVGWIREEKGLGVIYIFGLGWKEYEELTFFVDAPVGHLPTCFLCGCVFWVGVWWLFYPGGYRSYFNWRRVSSSLASRLVECNI